MAQIFLQQTDTASVDPIGDFGTGGTVPPTPSGGAKGFTATNGGAAGSISGGQSTFLMSSVGNGFDGVMWETAAGEVDAYQCPAGNWVVPVQGQGSASSGSIATLDEVFIIRVNSSGVAQQTIGHVGSLGLVFPSAVLTTNTATVSGAAATFSTGDRVVILCAFANGPTGTNLCAMISTQIIATPMTGTEITRNATRFISDFLGLTSGSQRLYSIAGCAAAASAAMIKYVADFLGYTSGSEMLFSIASCLGLKRAAEYLGLTSGSQGLYGIADCCPPATSGSVDIASACLYCSGVLAAQFSLLVSGVTSLSFPGSCNCSPRNGTFILIYNPSKSAFPLTCTWDTAQSALCGENDFFWELRWTGSLGLELTAWIGTTHIVIYRSSFTSPWDCVSPLTLTLYANTVVCDTEPVTLTVNPV